MAVCSAAETGASQNFVCECQFYFLILDFLKNNKSII